MTADLYRDTLADALGEAQDAVTNVVVRGASLADATVTRFDLTANLATEVAADLRRSVEGLLRREFVAYDPSYQTSSAQALVENLAEIPELAALDARIREGDLAEEVGGDGVVAMAHTLGVGDHRIVAYRTSGSGIATKQRSGLTLLPRKGVYGPVGGDVLYYEPRFEAFTCADFTYFTSATFIQSKLRAPEKAQAMARQTLQKATTSVRIDGYAELESAVMGDPALRAKMAAVARLLDRDPDYAALLTTERLVGFVKDNPAFKIPVSTTAEGEALRFDTSPQYRHQIPRLLADDYLYSRLTARSYEAGSKQRVE